MARQMMDEKDILFIAHQILQHFDER